MGCGRRISSGITRAFRRYERAIILEDDCVPDDSFFPFCEELLARYAGDQRVAQIGGANCMPASEAGSALREGPESYYFSRFTNCWGWATWRRAWEHYQYELPLDAASSLPRALPREARKALARSFQDLAAGSLDTWDYQWTHACMAEGMLSVVPAGNMVSNIGFGAGATHTMAGHAVSDLPRRTTVFPLVHPPVVEANEKYDNGVARLLYWRAGPLERLVRSIRKRLGRR